MRLDLAIRLEQGKDIKGALSLFKQCLGKQSDCFLVVDEESTQLQSELDLAKAERVFVQLGLANGALFEKDSHLHSSLPQQRIIIYMEDFALFHHCFTFIHCPRDLFRLTLARDQQGKYLVVSQGKSYQNQREFKCCLRIPVKTLNNYNDQLSHLGSTQSLLRARMESPYLAGFLAAAARKGHDLTCRLTVHQGLLDVALRIEEGDNQSQALLKDRPVEVECPSQVESLFSQQQQEEGPCQLYEFEIKAEDLLQLERLYKRDRGLLQVLQLSLVAIDSFRALSLKVLQNENAVLGEGLALVLPILYQRLDEPKI